ncbi:hypothetical protein Aperf_G00000010457 [Anoplocephala perfoliata]
MSLSRCIELAKIRDFIHLGEEIIYYTEAEKTFQIFLYLPGNAQCYGSSISPAFLKTQARQLNFPNIQLLLSWIRDQTSTAKFSIQADDSEKINFVVGSGPPVQLTFQLSKTHNDVDLIVSLSKALLSKQASIAELEKSNTKSLDELSAQDAFPSTPNKQRKVGMDSVNPQRRKRKPATGLAFVSDDEN